MILLRTMILLFCFVSSIFASEDLSKTSLDSYLQQHGFYLSPVHSKINEGYSSEAQRKAFREDFENSPQIKTIAEIGFNAGHSCEAFLESSENTKVTTFDINHHPYTKLGVEFMKKKYPSRFEFIEGDSNQTVKKFADSTGKKFDLIFIDGCHEFYSALNDIRNCQRLAHRDTIVWIDDYVSYGVKSVVDHCVERGLIKIIETKNVSDQSGPRYWAKVKYEYLSDAEKFFTNIYDNGLWGRDREGNATSGPGSLLSEGGPFIHYVNNFLKSREIGSIVDLGCGDWVLAREYTLEKREYLGIDIVESLIKKNQALYGSDTIRFLVLDAGFDPLPEGDLLICKDVLMHLPDSYVFHVLTESKKFKHCIFVNDINPSGTKNHDLPSIGFRCLDLTRPPYNLKPKKVENYISGNALKQIVLIEN